MFLVRRSDGFFTHFLAFGLTADIKQAGMFLHLAQAVETKRDFVAAGYGPAKDFIIIER
jgi:hypothetical protein